ncbi:hypothetical protein DENSPDRAFT_885570, partial [Dentipellis sp. KUC8613]
LRQVTSSGRGGAGNIRSPSRGRPGPTSAADAERAQEREIIRNADEARVGMQSSGRGGIGNIARSQSRSHSRPPQHSTGRGGAGNIKPGDAMQADILELQDEEWASAHMPHVGLHSTGRGGAANITPDVPPPVDSPPHAGTQAHLAQHHTHEFESSGRGGAGNIVRSRSASRGADAPEREGREKHAHGIAALLQRVSRSGSRAREEAEREKERGRSAAVREEVA